MLKIRPRGFEPLTFGSGDQRSIRTELRARSLDSSSYRWGEWRGKRQLCRLPPYIQRSATPKVPPDWSTKRIVSDGRDLAGPRMTMQSLVEPQQSTMWQNSVGVKQLEMCQVMAICTNCAVARSLRWNWPYFRASLMSGPGRPSLIK